MATVTAALIKELRDRTGISMSACKSALEEANGDMELAISNLRKKGMASAVKKEGRAANEGMIAFAEDGNTIAIVEVNAETDFVVRNDRFKQFLQEVAQEIVKTKPASLEAFLKQPYSKDSSLTIDEYRATQVQAIGENIQIRRLVLIEKTPSKSIGVYSHLGGKIVTAVELEGSNDAEGLAKDIAMHVAAASPEYLNPESVPSNVIEHEKEIAKSQVQGKPANIVDKIVEGKVNAFFDAVCLSRQKFIKDDAVSINELVEKFAKASGKPLQLVHFMRWNVGG
ncbi:MAG: translation elongation factor Ts [Parachlamydiaceae bacterium]